MSTPLHQKVDQTIFLSMFCVFRSFFSVIVIYFFLPLTGFTSDGSAQAPSAQQKFQFELPLGSTAKRADEFLVTLRPPISVQALESGNDLLLDFPFIAPAGLVRFKIVSTISRTDGLWLLSLSRQPESGSALFASVALEPPALPEVSLLLTLSKTQSVLLVARAGGKYYGLQREIKIGQTTAPSGQK